MKKEYEITITETYCRKIYIEAESYEDAEERAEKYNAIKGDPESRFVDIEETEESCD